MRIEQARFATATVMALRCATATKKQLRDPAPSLRDLNVDLADCTEADVAELKALIDGAWRRRQLEVFGADT